MFILGGSSNGRMEVLWKGKQSKLLCKENTGMGECSLVVEHLPSIQEVQGSIPSIGGKKKIQPMLKIKSIEGGNPEKHLLKNKIIN